MRNLIQLLPDHIANQIAAGEVIQRPASVVKELVENAIDAGATRIDVSIKDAGRTLIQIVDNGAGMTPDDAKLCFERHATSKIRKAEDLFALSTKGFRGEALASIAAIAHVDLRTKRKGSATGTLITIEGSNLKKQEETVAPKGTSFEVKNLFFNVPARRNFLKSNQVEFRHIQDEFERVALAHPSVHFTLQHNNNELHNLTSGVLRKRIVDVLGKKSNDRLVPIEEETDIVTLKGFVLKPEFARKTRSDQYLFVNDRFFKSHYFNHAIGKAYEGLIKEKMFPGYFLYLEIDPRKIDVNVHPTKTEIKFEEEKFIYSIILSSIRQALGKYNIAPTLDFERETSFDIPHSMRSQPVTEPRIQVDPDYNPFEHSSPKARSPIRSAAAKSSSPAGKKSENQTKGITRQGFGNKSVKAEEWENFYSIEDETQEIVQSTITPEPEALHVPTPRNSLVKGSYLLSASKSGFMVIHIRRAIEQIVYSNMIKSFISSPVESQKLLFPIEKELSKNEIAIWKENETMLRQLGFEGSIEDELLSLSAVPNVLQEETILKSLENIIETIAYKEIDKGDIAHELVYSIARSASMKKLDLSSEVQAQALVEQLFQCENHMFTPGNKKIIDTLDISILDQKFK